MVMAQQLPGHLATALRQRRPRPARPPPAACPPVIHPVQLGRTVLCRRTGTVERPSTSWASGHGWTQSVLDEPGGISMITLSRATPLSQQELQTHQQHLRWLGLLAHHGLLPASCTNGHASGPLPSPSGKPKS